MSEFTQKDYDEGCELMKNEINKMVDESGQSSLAMAVAMNSNSEITQGMVYFQEDVNPKAKSIGIKTKSLSEIFGTEITLSVN